MITGKGESSSDELDESKSPSKFLLIAEVNILGFDLVNWLGLRLKELLLGVFFGIDSEVGYYTSENSPKASWLS